MRRLPTPLGRLEEEGDADGGRGRANDPQRFFDQYAASCAASNALFHRDLRVRHHQIHIGAGLRSLSRLLPRRPGEVLIIR